MNNERIARNLKKPKGKLGRKIGEGLLINESVYKQFEEIIDIARMNQVLEIGFGPGFGLKYYLEKYSVHFDGIDFSRDMHTVAKQNCKKYIDEGRARLEKSDIKNWRSNRLYDLVFLFNVIYFFDILDRYLGIVAKHLKKGGTIGIFMDDPDVLNTNPVTQNPIFNKYTIEQVIDVLGKLGFIDINVVEHREYNGSFYITGVLD